MNFLNNLPLLGFLLLNIGVALFAFFRSPVKKFSVYAGGSANVSKITLIMTLLATLFSGVEFGYLNFILRHGLIYIIRAFLVVIAILFATTLLIPSLVRETKALTIGEIMCKAYGPWMQIITGSCVFLLSFIAFKSNVNIMLRVGTDLLDLANPRLPKNTATLFTILGLVVALVYLLGGMKTMYYGHTLQMSVGILLFIVLFTKMYSLVGGFGMVWKYLPERKSILLDNPDLYPFIRDHIFTIPFFILSVVVAILPKVAFVEKERKIKSVAWVSVLYIIGMLILIFLGLGERLLSEKLGIKGQDISFFTIVINMFNTREGLIIQCLSIGIMGILLSTIDTYLHVATLAIMTDIIDPLRTLMGKHPLSEKKKLMTARTVALCVAFTFFGMVFYFKFSNVIYSYLFWIICLMAIIILSLLTVILLEEKK